MAEAEWGLLSSIRHLPGLGEPGIELVEQVGLATLTQIGLELDSTVEMIVDRALSSACNKEKLLDTCRFGFLDSVMNERLVDNRQHLLGHRLGRRKKAGSQPGDREDSFADAFVHEPLDRVPRGQGRFICHDASPTGKWNGL